MVSRRGFTLIELLTVIAILGILVLLAAPKFLGYTEKANIAKIQTGIKSMEAVIDLNSMNNQELTEDWIALKSEEIQEINSSNKLINKRGLIESNLKEGSKYIPMKRTGDFDSIKWHGGGVFILSEDKESVYYYNKDGKGLANSGDGENTNTIEIIHPNGDVELEDGTVFPASTEDEFTWTPYVFGYSVPGLGTGYYKYTGDKTTVITPKSIDKFELSSYYRMFSETEVDKVINYNEKVEDFSDMFYRSKATTLDLSLLDTSNVTDMSGMFEWASSTTLDLTTFDTSKVVNMDLMFSNSFATTLDLSSFDTSKVEDMSGMFAWARVVDLDLTNFNTSNVLIMASMFYSSQITSLDISSFDTSKVTSMQDMFYQFKGESLDLSKFDTSNVKSMSHMFDDSEVLNLDLSKFDTSNVEDMSYMFHSSKVESLDLSAFVTLNTYNMSNMFGFTELTYLDLSSFDFDYHVNVSGIFDGSLIKTVVISDESYVNKLNTSTNPQFQIQFLIQ